MGEFCLTPEQEAAVRNRGGSLLVSAAAGSGKTRVLVERLLSYVTDPTHPRNINEFLVITYTKAAAAELRGRILDALADRLASDPGNRHLQRQMTLVYRAEISTIHGFCAALLREHAHLLDLRPDFRVLDEAESGVLKLRILQEVLNDCYENMEPGFSQLVDTLSAGWDDSRLAEILLDVHAKVQSHPIPDAWLDTQLDAFRADGVLDARETLWGKSLLQYAAGEADYCRRALSRALRLMAISPALNKKYAPSFSETVAALDGVAAAARSGWDALATLLPVPFPRLGPVKNPEDPELMERVKQIRENCKKRLKKIEPLFSVRSAPLLADLKAVFPAMEALFRLTKQFDEAYLSEKRRRALVDFSDLEHLALLALTGGVSRARTELSSRIAARYCEILIDEYQDTNAVQNAIFDAVSRDGKNLFCVGDVKQSIYRFRLADPTIFIAKYSRFKPWESASDGEERRIILSRNFRSRPQILDAVNFIFENIMSAEFGEIDYSEDQRLFPGAAFPPREDNAVELAVLDLSSAPLRSDGSKQDRAELEARYIAGRIRSMLDGGCFVSNPAAGGLRPANAGDIVILMRSKSGTLSQYVRALSALDIPCCAEIEEDFFAAVEIQVVFSLLSVIDNPLQDVPLISVLRSPVFGLSADRLAELRAGYRTGCFYDALQADAEAGAEDSRAVRDTLYRLRERAGEMSTHSLIWHIYSEMNLLAVFGAMPGGDARTANLWMLFEHARRFETSEHRGLFEFLNFVRRLRENGETLAPPSAGERSNAVRIMTIHKSKGLEFPIVFLAGSARRFNRADVQRPLLMHPRLGVGPRRLELDRMLEYPTLPRLAVAQQLDAELLAEELRLLYVAMTRARETLVLVCSSADAAATLKKLGEVWSAPVDPQVLAAMASVSEWILLAALGRPEAQDLRAFSGPVGILPAEVSGSPWSISLISCGAEEDAAHPELLENQENAAARPAIPDPVREAADYPEGLTEHLFDQYPYAAQTEIPSKLTATQLKGRPEDNEAAEDAPRPPKAYPFLRPRFAMEDRGLTPTERGTALHLAMQYIDFGQTGSVAEIRAELDRLVACAFLTPEQGDCVDPGKLAAFFASPLGYRLRTAPGLTREFKFSVLLPAADFFPDGGDDPILLQGVVDCFWEEGGGLAVLDFKSDRVKPGGEPERAGEYRGQLSAYSRALTEITGLPVIRRILYFFATGCAVEVPG